jgi:hypothetical protein
MSLIISLSYALIATLLQQWARRYIRVTGARHSLQASASTLVKKRRAGLRGSLFSLGDGNVYFSRGILGDRGPSSVTVLDFQGDEHDPEQILAALVKGLQIILSAISPNRISNAILQRAFI